MSNPTSPESDDYYVEGFEKIDQSLILRNPPRIRWGSGYQEKSPGDKIIYLEKLASAMNHAAFLVQGERDELNRLIILKEAQLLKQSDSVSKNNAMLQQEVTKMNTERQGFNDAVKKLNQRIRELEKDE